MKRLSLFIIHYSLFISCATAQPLMRDVFAAMPDSVLPLVTKNNRLDCIDFIENNMEAKARNILDEYVILEALTKDYARFRTSAVSLMELKLLPVTDSTSVLCIVTTAESGEKDTPTRIEDSSIRLMHTDWSPLSASDVSSVASVKEQTERMDFFVDEVPDSIHMRYEQAKASMRYFHPVRMQLSADDNTVTISPQTGQLAVEEKKVLKGRLRSVVMAWDGQSFKRM